MSFIQSYLERFPGDLVTFAGRTLFVRSAEPISPGAEPAVFIHGLGGSSTNWTDLMAALRGEVNGIAPDLPGFGHSPPPADDDFSPIAHARAVADLIRWRFPGETVHVFGNSLGGAISVQLAARYPELVRSVTLISPALPDRAPRLSAVHLPIIAVPGLGERMTKLMYRRPVRAQVATTMELVYADPSRVLPQRWEEAVEDARIRRQLPHAVPALLASLRGLMATYFDRGPQRPWQLARQVTVPVLLVYGRQDKLVNPAAAHRASRAFPNARVAVVPDSGHVAQMEHTEVVVELWRELARQAQPRT